MRPECWILIWLMVPVNGQARDPFHPPQKVCVDMPAEWHYRGLLDRGVACTAIVQGPAGKWYRVQTGGRLPGDLHILAITWKMLLVKPADSCTGKTLRWEYQERVDEGNQRFAIITADALLPSASALSANHLSLTVDDVPVAQVLQALAESEKRNLVVAPGVDGMVSLHLDNVSWMQAFRTVVESAGLYWRR